MPTSLILLSCVCVLYRQRAGLRITNHCVTRTSELAIPPSCPPHDTKPQPPQSKGYLAVVLALV